MILKAMHKWIAIIVFLQLIVWLSTGFLLGKLNHELASGKNTFIQLREPQTSKSNLLNLNTVLKSYPMASEIALTRFLGSNVYKITITKGVHAYQASSQFLIDGHSGKQIKINESQAIKLAKNSYQGHLEVAKVQFLQPPIEDLSREQNPVWRVDTRDVNSTSIFVSAQSGQVIAHVNQETRWRDLLMMLHFMDYAQEGSFNNIFMKIFAIFTLLQAITGIWWTIRLLRTKQFRFSWFSKTVMIKINNTEAQTIASLPLKKGNTLLSELNQNGISIPSICGGGGVCGKCRFKNHGAINTLSTDTEHISSSDINRGYRLACQHYVNEISEITLTKLHFSRSK